MSPWHLKQVHRIMEGSAGAAEQAHYAQRLIATGERLQRRADATDHPVIDGEVLGNGSQALPGHSVERHREV